MHLSSFSSDRLRARTRTTYKEVRRALVGSQWSWIATPLSSVLYQRQLALLVWGFMLVLVAISELLPGSSTPMMLLSRTHLSDKLVHFSAYAALAVIPTLGLRYGTVIACIAITEVAGIVLEFAQSFIPGRSTDVYDAAANTAGILAGMAIAIVIRFRSLRPDREEISQP